MKKSKVPISSKLVAVNTLSFIVVRLLHISVFLWVQQYLLHRISPEEYGVYQVIGSLFFLMPILNNIFTSSSSRYVVNYFANGEIDKAREVIFNIFWVLLFVAIILIIGTTVLSVYIGSIFVIPAKYVGDAQMMLWMFSFIMVFFLIVHCHHLIRCS